MTYTLTIPSVGRPDLIRTHTIAYLETTRIDLSTVEVWVLDEERDAYAASIGDLNVRFRSAERGLDNVTNQIVRAYDGWVIRLDDDMKRFAVRLDDKNLDETADLADIIDEGIRAADLADLRLWGVHPVCNPLFMNDQVDVGLHLIAGGMFGIRPDGTDADLVTHDEKEDYERTCKRYLADGAVLRLSRYSWRTSSQQSGGMAEDRTIVSHTRGSQRIARAFPELASIDRSRRSGRTEIRLRDKRPVSSTNDKRKT